MSQKTKNMLAEVATLSVLFGVTIAFTLLNVIRYLP
ncbi:hypothetical protein SAMN05660772_00718 [Pasteurella testudinis DSM 23072]|uniref:Uncharacterized protein n=1 Tax=Pasteurella testudinis DSM 23072 TaxID=1122938 RepID=A0A1W1URX1_9PAST|nr:hypothetical protein SAMN05660772_00718 [Pasteurella testudinis DSM 23072]SUB50959.1 Uncharacterised protein [Pasteurella testudinis]